MNEPVLNVIFNVTYGTKLWLTGSCFSPWKVIPAAGLGKSTERIWSGMDDDNIKMLMKMGLDLERC